MQHATNLEDWKHHTATVESYGRKTVGIDLFDDEEGFAGSGRQISVYKRHSDGRRSACRTICMRNREAAEDCLRAWAKLGVVHDYRTLWHGVFVQGIDMRQAA